MYSFQSIADITHYWIIMLLRSTLRQATVDKYIYIYISLLFTIQIYRRQKIENCPVWLARWKSKYNVSSSNLIHLKRTINYIIRICLLLSGYPACTAKKNERHHTNKFTHGARLRNATGFWFSAFAAPTAAGRPEFARVWSIGTWEHWSAFGKSQATPELSRLVGLCSERWWQWRRWRRMVGASSTAVHYISTTFTM